MVSYGLCHLRECAGCLPREEGLDGQQIPGMTNGLEPGRPNAAFRVFWGLSTLGKVCTAALYPGMKRCSISKLSSSCSIDAGWLSN
jgi:hypothetical protein